MSGIQDRKRSGFFQFPTDCVMEKGEKKKKKKDLLEPSSLQNVAIFLCPRVCCYWLSQTSCCFKVAKEIKGQRKLKVEI